MMWRQKRREREESVRSDGRLLGQERPAMSRHSHEVAGSHGLRTRSEGPGAESSREQVVGRVSPLSLSCSRRNVFLARTRISLQSKPKSLRQAERNPFHGGPKELEN